MNLRAWLVCSVALGANASCHPPRAETPTAPWVGAVERAIVLDEQGNADAAADAWLFALEGSSEEVWLGALGAFFREDPEVPVASSDLLGRTREPEHLLRTLVDKAPSVRLRLFALLAAHRWARHHGSIEIAAWARRESGCLEPTRVEGPVSWAVRASEKTFDSAELRTATPSPIEWAGRGCDVDLATVSARPGVRRVTYQVTFPRAGKFTLGVMASGPTQIYWSKDGALKFDLVARHSAGLGRAWIDLVEGYVSRAGTFNWFANTSNGTSVEPFSAHVWDEQGHPQGISISANAAIVTDVSVELRSHHYAQSVATRWLDISAGSWLGWPDARVQPGAGRFDSWWLALAESRAALMDRVEAPPLNYEPLEATYAKVVDVEPRAFRGWLGLAAAAAAKQRGPLGAFRAAEILDAGSSKPFAARGVLQLVRAHYLGIGGRFDLARVAWGNAGVEKSTHFGYEIERSLEPARSVRAVQLSCDDPRRDFRSTACFDALMQRGDLEGADRELARFRAREAAPRGWVEQEAQLECRRSNKVGVRVLLDGRLALCESVLSADSQLALERASLESRMSSKEILAAFDVRTQRALEVHSRTGADATDVLDHDEHYAVQPNGLLHFRLYDVRRLGGTTDIESNADAARPTFSAVAQTIPLRRRIFKHDGRVVVPQPTPGASQDHADLVQLEKGDSVETVLEGWVLASSTGVWSIDTPDLAPMRTHVEHATLEIAWPKEMQADFKIHSALGKPGMFVHDGFHGLRIEVSDINPLPLEFRVPTLDRTIGIVWTTNTQARSALGLYERLLGSAVHTQQVRGEALRLQTKTREAGSALARKWIAAVAKRLRMATPWQLSDWTWRPEVRETHDSVDAMWSAREGVRSLVIAKGFDQLGIPNEVVVAEEAPFSSAPTNVARTGRFVRPLVRAKIDGRWLWIDADGPGRPLPLGHVSRELIGKSYMSVDGLSHTIEENSVLPARPDEVTITLSVGEAGSAEGSLEAKLCGTDALEFADMLPTMNSVGRDFILKRMVHTWLPGADVRTVDVRVLDDLDEVHLRATLDMSRLVTREASTGRLRIPGLLPLRRMNTNAYAQTLAESYAAERTRVQPLSIDDSTFAIVRRRLSFPSAWQVSAAPNSDVKSALVTTQRRLGALSTSGGATTVEEVFEVRVRPGTVPVAEFSEFAETVVRADAVWLRGTWFTDSAVRR